MSEDQKEITPETKPKRKRQPKDEGPVIFRSTNEEPREFIVNGIRARRCHMPGRCEWHVPADQAERFQAHFHVQRGRIERVGG